MVHIRSRARGRRGARGREHKPPHGNSDNDNPNHVHTHISKDPWIYFNTFLVMIGAVFGSIARLIRCFVIAVILSCNAAVNVFTNTFRKDFGAWAHAYGIYDDKCPTTVPFAKESNVCAPIITPTPTHRAGTSTSPPTVTLDIEGNINWFASPTDEFEHDVNTMRDYDWPEVVLEREGADDLPEIKKTKIVYDKCDDDMLDAYMERVIGDDCSEIPVGEGYSPTQADYDKHMSPTRGMRCSCKRDAGDNGYLCKRCLAKFHKERVDTKHLRGSIPICNCARGVCEPSGGLCKRCRELKPRKTAVISCNCVRKPGDPAIGLCAKCTRSGVNVDRTLMSWRANKRDKNKQFIKDLPHSASNWAGIKERQVTVNEYKTVTDQQNGENMYDFILDEYNEMNRK